MWETWTTTYIPAPGGRPPHPRSPNDGQLRERAHPHQGIQGRPPHPRRHEWWTQHTGLFHCASASWWVGCPKTSHQAFSPASLADRKSATSCPTAEIGAAHAPILGNLLHPNGAPGHPMPRPKGIRWGGAGSVAARWLRGGEHAYHRTKAVRDGSQKFARRSVTFAPFFFRKQREKDRGVFSPTCC